MQRAIYLTLQEALTVQRELIERFGGSHGVRDMGLLESALARPQSGYYETLFEQAAALFHSIASNHCFVDGNKRAAVVFSLTFLKVNGVQVRLHPAGDAEKFIINHIIKSRADVREIAEWLESHRVSQK